VYINMVWCISTWFLFAYKHTHLYIHSEHFLERHKNTTNLNI
jgi:hypothetical protein